MKFFFFTTININMFRKVYNIDFFNYIWILLIFLLLSSWLRNGNLIWKDLLHQVITIILNIKFMGAKTREPKLWTGISS